MGSSLRKARRQLDDRGYCPAIRPGLNGPKPTAQEYLSFPLLLCLSNESSRFCLVWSGSKGLEFIIRAVLGPQPKLTCFSAKWWSLASAAE